MDCSALLKAQQQDFYNRLRKGHSLISPSSIYYGEGNILASEVINTITLESVAEVEKVSKNGLADISSQEIFNLLFSRYLAKESFLSQFKNLTYLEPCENEYNQSNLTNCSFTIENKPQTKILLKFYHGDLNNLKLSLSLEELKKHQIFVFSFCPQNINDDKNKLKLIFLGFIPFSLIKKKTNQIVLSIEELLYIGGLQYYLDNNFWTANNLSQTAKKYMKKGEYDKSIDIFTKMINLDYQVDENYFLRGICQYKLGHKKLALQDINQAIKIDQKFTNRHHWQGLIYQDLGEYQKAHYAYTQEIKRNKVNLFAYFQRAIVNTKLNKLIDALEDYNIAIKISNKFFQTYYNRAHLYFNLGDKYSAIKDYKQAIKIKPNLYQAHYNLAIIYQQLGNNQQAIKEYELTIKINPQYINSYYNLAILLSNIGFYQKAVNYYKQSLKIAPNFIQSRYNCESLTTLLENHKNITSDNSKPDFLAISKDIPKVLKLEDPNSTVVKDEDKLTTISGE